MSHIYLHGKTSALGNRAEYSVKNLLRLFIAHVSCRVSGSSSHKFVESLKRLGNIVRLTERMRCMFSSGSMVNFRGMTGSRRVMSVGSPRAIAVLPKKIGLTSWANPSSRRRGWS